MRRIVGVEYVGAQTGSFAQKAAASFTARLQQRRASGEIECMLLHGCRSNWATLARLAWDGCIDAGQDAEQAACLSSGVIGQGSAPCLLLRRSLPRAVRARAGGRWGGGMSSAGL